MKKILFGILLLLTALLTVVFVIAQTCDTQGGSVVGFTGGDDSTIYELQGIKNDLESLQLRLKYKGANFSPSGDYDVTSNGEVMTGGAADFNGDGLVDLIEGARGLDDDDNGYCEKWHPVIPGLCNVWKDVPTRNLQIFISQGIDPADPERFKFEGPHYIEYSESFYGTFEMIALGTGDYDGDGDADITAMSWAGNLYIFWNKYEELSLSPGDDPEFDEIPTSIMNVIDDGISEYDTGSSNFRWESNIASVDIDGDHDLDLIVGVPTNWGDYGQVVILYCPLSRNEIWSVRGCGRRF
jgi:hypothetical protein